MNSDAIQIVGLAVLILAEQYAVAPWQFPVFAKLWDFLANLFSALAVYLAYMSYRSRQNYYLVVNAGA